MMARGRLAGSASAPTARAAVAVDRGCRRRTAVLAAGARSGGRGALRRLALACVHQEYPNKIAHVLNGDADVRPPRELTPAFYGCYDWHSSVHGHWLLARLARTFPDAPFAAEARAALGQSLTPENIAAEVAYLDGAGRASVRAAVRAGVAAAARRRAARVGRPAGARRGRRRSRRSSERRGSASTSWLPKLSHPIRVGEHDQTAFAFGLVARLGARRRRRGDGRRCSSSAIARLLPARTATARSPTSRPAQDFLSPCLAEADLMRRVLPPAEFAAWLRRFLPAIPTRRPRDVARRRPSSPIRADPKLAHLDGLNLSRAWMLEGIAAGCPPATRAARALQAAAAAHREAGLAAVTGEHYEGGHWLGTFAVYLATGAGPAGVTGVTSAPAAPAAPRTRRCLRAASRSRDTPPSARSFARLRGRGSAR